MNISKLNFYILEFNIKYSRKINPRKYRIGNVTEMNTYFN